MPAHAHPGSSATAMAATEIVASGVAAELARLATLDRDGLAAAWIAAYRVPVPQSASRAFLLKAVAHHAQVGAERDVRPAVRKALLQIGRALRDGTPSRLPPAAPSLKPGARLIRAFRGETHEVTVAADGRFEWRGRRHRSLSRIATAITGSRRNGPAFFGLREADANATPSAGSGEDHQPRCAKSPAAREQCWGAVRGAGRAALGGVPGEEATP